MISGFSASGPRPPGPMPGPPVLTLTLTIARAAEDHAEGFIFQPQRYLSLGSGGDVMSSTFDWDQSFREDLAAVHQLARDPAILQRIGDRMRDFAARMHWSVFEPRVREVIRQGGSVEITIRAAASEIYALPWELLPLRSSGEYIGGLSGVLLRYEWPDTHTIPPARPSRPGIGRLLFAYSGDVRANEHIQAIMETWSGPGRSFDPDRDMKGHASLGDLDDALQAAKEAGDPVSVLHLLCHGAHVGSTFGLALDEGELGRIVPVDAGRLGQVFGRHAATLRLVILSACNSGNVGHPGNKLGSVAQALHRAGIATVIASRYPLSRDGSLAFTTAFYRKLAATSDVKQAFLAARTQVATDPRKLDWASLQLYGRDDRDQHQEIQAGEGLSHFQTLLREKQAGVTQLKEYKELHDQLQALEAPFDAIVDAAERLSASPAAWSELEHPLTDLQKGIGRILKTCRSEPLKSKFGSCQQYLAQAAELLQVALAGTPKVLSAALFCIHRVLIMDLSNANNYLHSAAHNLHLDVTVVKLREALGRLRPGQLPGGAIDELHRLVAELETLHAPLDALVREHHQWQEIGNQIRPVIGNDRFDVGHVRLSWELMLTNLQPMLQGALDADWAQPVDTEIKKQTARLTDNADAQDYIECLRRVWRPCNQRFGAVDKQLLETCRELGNVGGRFDTVFRMI